MKQYGLSVSKLLGILRKPERKEKGIVPGTTAVMKTNPPSPKASAWRSKKLFNEKLVYKPKKALGEIWIMYKDVTLRRGSGQAQSGENIRKIISAWRYPGISKPGEAIPIPDDIRQEILNNN